MFGFLIFVAVVTAAVAVEDLNFSNRPEIETTGGSIRGERASCGFFCSYYRFRGIPYAQPPVDNLRFRAPLPHKGWTGVREATQHGHNCPSNSIIGGTNSSEDCLSLNVYSPNLSGRLPVMVWVHGGSFQTGSGNDWVYGPDYIVDDGVIMVTVNYRLGALGFLSTGDNHAPGNYGLKDVILALQWVRANIIKFGGDPDNVTIFGESAGGVAIHYLILSPSARGLFTRAISQSGSALNPWAFEPNPERVAHQLARDMGIAFTDNEDLINKLRFVDPSVILRSTPGMMQYPLPRGILPIPFVPCQDPPNVNPDEVFLPRTPIQIMNSGTFNRVPYITGFNSAESLFSIRELLIDWNLFATYNNNPHLLIPASWNVPATSPDAAEIIKQIRDLYFRGGPLTNDMRYEYAQYNTDLMFAHGIDQTARIHASFQTAAAPVYYYKFSFDGALNLIKTMLLLNDYPGAMHADELFYLFRITNIPPPLLPTNSAINTRRRMVRMWTNFARNSNPTPLFDFIATTRWNRVSGGQQYLEIGPTVRTGTFPNDERMSFWNRLQAKYQR